MGVDVRIRLSLHSSLSCNFSCLLGIHVPTTLTGCLQNQRSSTCSSAWLQVPRHWTHWSASTERQHQFDYCWSETWGKETSEMIVLGEQKIAGHSHPDKTVTDVIFTEIFTFKTRPDGEYRTPSIHQTGFSLLSSAHYSHPQLIVTDWAICLQRFTKWRKLRWVLCFSPDIAICRIDYYHKANVQMLKPDSSFVFLLFNRCW